MKQPEAAELVPNDAEIECLIAAEPRYYGGPPERLYRVPPTRLYRFEKLIKSDPHICRVPKKAWGRLRQKLSDGDLTVHLLLSDGSLWHYPANFWRGSSDAAEWAFHRDRLTVRVANPDPYGAAITYIGYPIVLQSELEAVVARAAAAGETPAAHQLPARGAAPLESLATLDRVLIGANSAAKPKTMSALVTSGKVAKRRKRGAVCYSSADGPLIAEMHVLITTGGHSINAANAAAGMVVSKAIGLGREDSKLRRLRARYSQTHPESGEAQR